jgi:acyl-CoA synthetase (NDP forming)
VTSDRSPIVAMHEAETVALVGASERPGSVGETLVQQLRGGGYGGRSYAVNPRYTEIAGEPCYPSVASLPEPVDLVALAVPNAALEAELHAAAAAGARAAVIFATCFGPTVDGIEPLAARLARVATDSAMALCGGNGMGFLNLDRGLRVCGFHEPLDLEPGPVTFLSHSGSLFSAMLHNRRGLRFNLVVSTGMELVTTMDEYLAYAVEQPTTRAVGLFLETIRRPRELAAAVADAVANDVPIVAMKVGRSRQAREAVATHSAALAGEDAAYDAFFEAHGVLRVDSMDEMADTLELLASPRRAAPGGIATVHDSGGERVLLIDAADRARVPLAEIGATTRDRLAKVLDPGLEPVNPVDAWGTGRDANAVVEECLRALAADDAVGAVALCVDLTAEQEEHDGYAGAAVSAFTATDKPGAVLANLAGAVDPCQAAHLRAAGVPVLEGTSTGIRALGHLLTYRDVRARGPVIAPDPPDRSVVERWRRRCERGDALGELEALALVADFGVPGVAGRGATTADEAVDAAERLGYPVAVKTASPAVAHKVRAGGVHLGCTDAVAVRAAYADLLRLGRDVTVQAMAPPGTEVALGVVHDDQFGPLVLAATGGTLVEVLRDRRLALPPLDLPRARHLLERLALFTDREEASDSAPAPDLDAAAAALASLSVLAVELGDVLGGLDVNPLVVHEHGCVAADALAFGTAR